MNFYEKFKDFFSHIDRNTAIKLGLLFLAGVLLLVISGFLKQPSANSNTTVESTLAPEKISDMSGASYEEQLEARLEETLSLVSGAGNVKVMLTLSAGTEIEIASDTVSEIEQTDETDKDNGKRTIEKQREESKAVIVKQKDGSDSPVILRETVPKIAGVIIIAEGGGDVFIKDALVRAAQTVLSLEPHKIQVLKMK